MNKNLTGVILDKRYQLDALVGVGGMANVYKATDMDSGKEVAVKMLKSECLSNDELVRRFKNESKAISILNHPNIVKVWDVSSYDGVPYIVMEYIDGITLKEYLNQRHGPLTWKEVVHFISKILSALEHAHSKGVVHRDIKPQNIMLLADGNIKVMDFGIARFSRSQSYTVSDKAIGSVHYISPEQAKGDPTDATADIYSVGIMMYEMLSGRLPFEGDSAVSIAVMQISDQATPLNELVTNVPRGLQQITEKAMAKNPAERYQGAKEMLADINEFKKNPAIIFYAVPNQNEEPVSQPTKRTVSVSSAIKAPKRNPAPDAKTIPNNNATKIQEEAWSVSNPSRSQTKTQTIKGKKNTKKKKRFDFLPVFIGMTFAFAVASFILCYYIFATSTNPLFSTRKDLILPDFTGINVDQVQLVEGYSNLNVQYKESYNNIWPAGTIYDQAPRSGRTVKEGQKVTLTVSLGTHWVEIPSLKNYVSADAQEVLRELGVSVRVKYVINESYAAGTVFETDPIAGTTVESGSTVTIHVAQAKINTERRVPSVTGLKVEDARSLIAKNNLVAIVEETPSEAEAGIVIGQSISPNTEVKMGTKVTIQVSTGVPPAPVIPSTITPFIGAGGYIQFFDENEDYVVCHFCGHQTYVESDGAYYCATCGNLFS